MATTATAYSISFPSFTSLKLSAPPTTTRLITVKPPATRSSNLTVKASLKKAASAAIAAAATAMLAGNAMAMEVLLGTDDGGLAFVPNNATVASGEKIVFKNNAGFPHNVIFDEDEVPGGVDAAKISMNEEDLLNGPGETYEVTLTVKGTYGFYCSPHQGAGMTGKITVN